MTLGNRSRVRVRISVYESLSRLDGRAEEEEGEAVEVVAFGAPLAEGSSLSESDEFSLSEVASSEVFGGGGSGKM